MDISQGKAPESVPSKTADNHKNMKFNILVEDVVPFLAYIDPKFVVTIFKVA